MWHSISALACRLAVISGRFEGLARHHFQQPLAPQDRTRTSGAVFRQAGVRIKQANQPAGELQLRYRSPSIIMFVGRRQSGALMRELVNEPSRI